MGRAFDRSSAIILVVDEDDLAATLVLKGIEGTTNALAPAAKAKVAAISNFIVALALIQRSHDSCYLIRRGRANTMVYQAELVQRGYLESLNAIYK